MSEEVNGRSASDQTQSATVFAVSAFALSKGLSKDEVEDCVGVPLSRIIDGSRRVRADAPPRLCAALISSHPDDAIPVELGRTMPPSFMNEVGYTMQFAPNVGEALSVFSRFASLLADSGRFTLTGSSTRVAADWSHPADAIDGGIMQAAVIAFLWRQLGSLTKHRIGLDEVRLSAERLGLTDRYADYFGAKAVFNSGLEESGIVLRQDALEQPLEQSNSSIFEHCVRMLDERREYLQSADAGDNELHQVREVLRDNIHRGNFRVGSIADSLHMSLRSAQRLAAKHGTTLRQVVDEELLRAAEKMLADDPKRSLHSIAEALGYSDARAFRRSFQRLSGLTPAGFRKRARGGF